MSHPVAFPKSTSGLAPNTAAAQPARSEGGPFAAFLAQASKDPTKDSTAAEEPVATGMSQRGRPPSRAAAARPRDKAPTTAAREITPAAGGHPEPASPLTSQPSPSEPRSLDTLTLALTSSVSSAAERLVPSDYEEPGAPRRGGAAAIVTASTDEETRVPSPDDDGSLAETAALPTPAADAKSSPPQAATVRESGSSPGGHWIKPATGESSPSSSSTSPQDSPVAPPVAAPALVEGLPQAPPRTGASGARTLLGPGRGASQVKSIPSGADASPASSHVGPGRASDAHADDGAAAPAAGPQLPTPPPSPTMTSPVPAAAASPLTPVIPPTVFDAAAAAEARAQAIAAMVSASNQAVIQRAASGNLDVPELGRVAVRAASLGGRVDVDVTSDRAETRAALHASAGAMAADLRQAEVPLRHLRFDGTDAGSTTPDRSQREGETNDPSPRLESPDPVTQDPPAGAAPVGSVRIVL